MKVYVRASNVDLELNSNQLNEISEGLCSIVKKYFSDGNYSYTSGVKVTENSYDILRYTARPYNNYSTRKSSPSMNGDDRDKLNEFRSAVRSFLKPYGVTRVKFDIRNYKLRYGYVSGPDNFPMKELQAIYFN